MARVVDSPVIVALFDARTGRRIRTWIVYHGFWHDYMLYMQSDMFDHTGDRIVHGDGELIVFQHEPIYNGPVMEDPWRHEYTNPYLR